MSRKSDYLLDGLVFKYTKKRKKIGIRCPNFGVVPTAILSGLTRYLAKSWPKRVRPSWKEWKMAILFEYISQSRRWSGSEKKSSCTGRLSESRKKENSTQLRNSRRRPTGKFLKRSGDIPKNQRRKPEKGCQPGAWEISASYRLVVRIRWRAYSLKLLPRRRSCSSWQRAIAASYFRNRTEPNYCGKPGVGLLTERLTQVTRRRARFS